MMIENFHPKNANYIFAVELQNEEAYNELIDNLRNDLEEKRYRKIAYYENRNHTSKIVAFKNKYNVIEGVEFGITLNAVVRSRHYGGVILDWAVEIHDGYLMMDGINIEEIEERFDYLIQGRGVGHIIQAKKIRKMLVRMKDKLVAELEEVYKQYSEPLVVSARFSN
jgi:hypothetical protein